MIKYRRCSRIMIYIRIVAVLCMVAHSYGTDEWFEHLRPGITRPEILAIAGSPIHSESSSDRYQVDASQIVLEYQDDTLVNCYQTNPGGGAISRSLYVLWGGELREEHRVQRRRYMTDQTFESMPAFDGPHLCTSATSGVCYQIDNGYLIIEPIITLLGGDGFFADKAAKVTLRDSTGKETVLYRAMDHWSSLIPQGLSARQVNERRSRLLSLPRTASTEDVLVAFGHADSEMGSGLSYLLFYLPDGLLVVSTIGGSGYRHMQIVRPGDVSLSLDQWRAQSR